MNQSTTSDTPGDENVTQVANPDDTTLLPGDQAVLRVTRPEWMDPQEWARIKSEAGAFFKARVEELRSTAPAPCTKYTWCAEQHRPGDDEHSGNPIELAGSDGSGEGGWWAWPVQNPGREVVIVIEGYKVGSWTIPAEQVAAVLEAAPTSEMRAAFVELLAEIGEDLPEAES